MSTEWEIEVVDEKLMGVFNDLCNIKTKTHFVDLVSCKSCLLEGDIQTL